MRKPFGPIGPTLETERLILRPPAAEDFEPWVAFGADPEVAQFIGGVQTPAMVWRAMCAVAGAWTITGFSMFSVVEKESGRWIGRLGPWMPVGWPGTEVGWALAREAWGKGYAVEGATAAIDWAFDELGWDEVIHAIDPANPDPATSLGSSGPSTFATRCFPIRSTCRSRSGARLARAGARGS